MIHVSVDQSCLLVLINFHLIIFNNGSSSNDGRLKSCNIWLFMFLK